MFKKFIKDNRFNFIALIICIFVEIFVFNFNSIRMLGMEEKIVPADEIFVNGEQLILENNLTFIDDKSVVEIKNINEEVKSIYLDVETDSTRSYEVLFDIFYTDEANTKYYKYSKMYRSSASLCSSYERSKYIPCDFIGDTKDLKFEFSRANYESLEYRQFENIKINKIVLNKQIPFSGWNGIIRILIGFMIIKLLVYLKSNKFMNKTIEENEKNLPVIKNTIWISFTVLVYIMMAFNGSFTVKLSNDIYANEFVDALASGTVSLIEKPSQELINMENPYDYSQRENIEFKWDVAYYKGEYYEYFGILPAIVLLVPLKILFNINISSAVATFFFIILAIPFACELIFEIAKRYFKTIKCNILVLLTIFFLFGSRLLWIAARPFFYELVIASGFLMIMIGILYVIKSNLFDSCKIDYKKLFVGCSTLALAVACRPTLLFVSLLILPRLIKVLVDIIKNMKVEKKSIIKFVLAVVVPYMLVGVGLMIYNYVRFENPFEFGANYQLTVTDCSKMTFSIQRALMGLNTLLFNVPKFDCNFPYVSVECSMSEYRGIFYLSAFGGGILFANILPLVILGLPFMKKDMKKNEGLYKYILSLILIGCFLIMIETSFAGIAGRYMLDFAWMFNLATVLIVMFMHSEYCPNEKCEKIFINLLLFSVIICIFINFQFALIGEEENFMRFNTEGYYRLKYFMSLGV